VSPEPLRAEGFPGMRRKGATHQGQAPEEPVVEVSADGAAGAETAPGAAAAPPTARAEEGDRLAALVGEAKSELRHLIDDLDLHPAEVSISRLLLAHLTLGSNNLTEATSRYLRASGPVPAELAAYLDPRLEKLDRLLAEARGLIESTLPSKEARQKSASTTRPRKAAKTEVQR